jgi:hypothetical protein
MAKNDELRTLVDAFVARLSGAVEEHALAAARASVFTALGAPPRRGPGRPPKSGGANRGISAPAAPAPGATRKIRNTAKAARARQLQGRYIGALRSLSGAARERVKKIARDKGVAEAIVAAKSLARQAS